MIKEEYVSYDTAKLLKEAGYPQTADYINVPSKYLANPIRPTQAQAMRWLRDVMGLIVSPNYKYDGAWWVCIMSERFNIYKSFNNEDMDENLPNYEAAAEAGIQAACKYLIDLQK